MKKIIKWNKPEIRNNFDERQQGNNQDYINFISETILDVSSINPEFISVGGVFKSLEKNGIYIGSTIHSNNSFKKGLINKLNSNLKEVVTDYNVQISNIYPGNFSLLMDDNNKGLIIYSAYSDINSIAMIDLFSPLYAAKRENNIRQYNKIKSFLRILFSISKKNFSNIENIKISLEEIHKDLEKINIGADPEFSLVSKNNLDQFVNANQIVKSQFDFPIGADGHASILEMRPDHSNNIDEFLCNVEDVLKETSELIDSNIYDLITGGGRFKNEPLGGHIHFSGIKPNGDILKMLDDFIGCPIKSCKGGKRVVANNNYDQLSAFRNQPHGGFEYRTPPSFLINKKFTESVYIVSFLVVKTYCFYRKIQKDFEYNSPITIDDLKKLIDYDKYENQINYYFNFINSKSNIDGFVFEGWQISKLKQNQTFNVLISKSNDKLLDDLIKIKSINLYRPPFNEIKFYGIADNSAPFSAIHIDSEYIDSNVNVGFLHKWLRDYIRDASIVNFSDRSDNIENFIKNGVLSIGLTLQFRNLFQQSFVNENDRNKFLIEFIKKLSVYIRLSIKDKSLLDYSNEIELKEFETIKKLINRKNEK